MMIYEVNIVVDASKYEALCQWLGLHIEEVLHCSRFIDAETYELDLEDHSRRGISVHYFVSDESQLHRYLSDHAPRLKLKAQTEFIAPMDITRRTLTPVDLY